MIRFLSTNKCPFQRFGGSHTLETRTYWMQNDPNGTKLDSRDSEFDLPPCARCKECDCDSVTLKLER